MTKEQYLAGEVWVSLIFEPLDLMPRVEVAPLTAREIADRRWGMDRRHIDEARKEPANVD